MTVKKLVVFALIGMLFGCDTGPSSPLGFSLPMGDIAKGEVVFNKYQCIACHSLEGHEQESVAKELNKPVALGGKSTRIMTYATLVTSIINPSHKIAGRYNADNLQADGSSKMRNYNDVMSVQELIDLVSFLQPKYQLIPYERTHYERYR
ncbi:hypothetical protein R50072_12020 [Simiduia litorea]|uniref:c-type cytochrome n=1 Tax=Simiduia litorea TaxID=1435348 RepID=UPI0036F21B9A